jgi:hypothetical protein
MTTMDNRTLAAALDELVPPRPDGTLPGAGALGVGAHVTRMLGQLPELEGVVTEGLRALDGLARERGAASFADLAQADRAAVMGEIDAKAPGFTPSLTFLAYSGYYADVRVVTALGLEARAPFPQGYAVPETDFALLENVKRRGPRWRQC